MKKAIGIVLSGLGVLTMQLAPAQGTVYLSNLGEPSVGSVAVGSDSWVAAPFRTGTNSGGYSLNAIQLLMNEATGSPTGFSAFLYDRSNGPGNSLGSLSGLDPLTGGVFTYAASDIILSPSSYYYIVVTAATPVAQGSYDLNLAGTGYSSSEAWLLPGFYLQSTDGSTWATHRLLNVQFALDATAVPEPATVALAGLGLVGFSFWRRAQVK